MGNIPAADNVAALPGMATAHGVLILIIFSNMVFSLITITAIFQDNSELVRSIRVILINILVASVIGGLASAMYHISSPILISSSFSDSVRMHGPPAAVCHAFVFLHNMSSSGRVLFTAYYVLTVCIVVHYWHQPVLAPRNSKYFIIVSAVVWILAVTAGIPSLFSETVNRFCGSSSSSNITSNTLNISSCLSMHITVPYFAVSSIPIIITPVILIETACYIKRKSIGEHRDTKKALVKFGLFLTIIQGVNAFSRIVAPLLALGIGSLNDISLAFIIGITLIDLSRIPTNVLIIIFFKPVRDKLKRWICCCYHGRKRTTMNGSTTHKSTATA